MKKYCRMTWTDRLKIEALYNAGHTYRFISQQVGFSLSSVYSEIQHGLYEHMGAETRKRPIRYSAQIAQDYADYQATSKGVPIKLGNNHAYARYVAQRVCEGVSLDVIVNTLKNHGQWTVSTSTLYRYVDRGFIPDVTNKHLPEKLKRKRPKNTVRASRPSKGLSIEKRPKYINNRSDFGHWEMDSIIGKSEGNLQSLLTLTERKTRFEIILRAKAKTSAATVSALDYTLSKFPKSIFKSITVDNGSEFQDCYGMEHDRQGQKRLTVYYCHPYTSSERGTNERANRIARRFFPKYHSLYRVTQKDCVKAARIMNTIPRKILNYDTPLDRFISELKALDSPDVKFFLTKCSFGLDN